MKTRILKAAEPGSSDETVRQAAEALAAGSLVVFPTETVYGVGASAADPKALEALHRLKERPAAKPFTLHLADPEEAPRYAGILSPLTRRLIRRTWPGPLALVVPDRRQSTGPSGGPIQERVYWQGTVGLRCPRHALGRAILRAAGVPVVASSANRAGGPPPRHAQEAVAQLDGRVALIVDAGPTQYARPSTVVRIHEDDSYRLLREGAITARRVERLARTRILIICTGNLCRSPMAVGLVAKALAERFGCEPQEVADRGIELAGAGTGATDGIPASANAVQAMDERGIDIRDHRSQPMTVDALLAADYIWVMTRHHLEAVGRLAPEVRERACLIDPEGRDVADPLGGDVETYRTCARRVEEAVARRVQEIV